MNERDQLLEQLRDLRTRAEQIAQRADEILAEEADQRRRQRWTPVVIKGGLAGGLAASVISHVRGPLEDHPISAAVTALAAAGAIVAGMFTTTDGSPPSAQGPERPPIETSGRPSSTSGHLSPTSTAPTTWREPDAHVAPIVAGTSRRPATNRRGPSSMLPTTTPVTAPTSSPSAGPDAGCLLQIGIPTLIQACLLPSQRGDATQSAPPPRGD